MMTLFRGPLREPPARRRPIEHIPPAITPTGDSADQDFSEAELRLAQELSLLLARRPVKRPRPHPMQAYADIEPPEPAPRVLSSGSRIDQSEASERSTLTGPEPPDDRERLQSYNTNWLATARRIRRNRNLRLVASWSITLLVGGFIISVAAIILFGPPGGKFAFRQQEAAGGEGAEIRTSQAAPPEVRWQLD